jgi:hypothetical protein
MVDFNPAVQQLARTNFHRPNRLLATLMRKHEKSGDV